MLKKLSDCLRRHTFLCCVVLTGMLVLSVVAGISLGTAKISFSTVWRIILHNLFGLFSIDDIKLSTLNIVWRIRIPRALLGMVVGGSLTLSGISMQAFTKNPLAEPYVLGISSGASTGAVLAMLVGVSLPSGRMLSVPVGAFAGAILSIVLVYSLAKTAGEVAPIRLVLVGVAVSAILRAATNYLVYTAPQEAAVRQATFWMLGGLSGAEGSDVLFPLIVLVFSAALLYLLAMPLNAMMMGDSSAVTLGVNINLVRKILIADSALLTASAVSVSGCIGFVGLVVPHIVRSLVGSDHRRVIPISLLVGSILMIWADIAARMVQPPVELPVGIITALFGGPVFLWMIKARRYAFGK